MMFAKWHAGWLLALFASCAWGQIEIGKEPPDDLGVNPEGQKILISEHRGQLVVISFFASWCAPCRAELPALEGIQRTAGKDRIFVVAVNYKESPPEYRRILKQLKEYTLTFTHDRSGKLGKSYGVKGIPRLVVVGRDGKVAAQHVGYNEKDLPKLMDELERFWKESAPLTEATPATAPAPDAEAT